MGVTRARVAPFFLREIRADARHESVPKKE